MLELKPVSNPLWGGKMVYHINDQFIEGIGGYKEMRVDLDKIYLSKFGL